MASRSQQYKTTLLPLKKQLYGLSYAPDNHERIYYYFLVEAEKEQSFREVLKQKRPFNVNNYATVIEAGNGDAPPALKEELQRHYNAVL